MLLLSGLGLLLLLAPPAARGDTTLPPATTGPIASTTGIPTTAMATTAAATTAPVVASTAAATTATALTTFPPPTTTTTIPPSSSSTPSNMTTTTTTAAATTTTSTSPSNATTATATTSTSSNITTSSTSFSNLTTTTSTPLNTTTTPSNTTANTTASTKPTTKPTTTTKAPMAYNVTLVFYLDYDRLIQNDPKDFIPKFKDSIIQMLRNKYWFSPPITSVTRANILLTPGSVGMFQDRTTLAIVTLSSAADAARLTARLNSYLTLAISYAGYQFYPVPLGYQLSFLKAPGSRQQLIVTLILCSCLLAILIAMYATYMYRRKNTGFNLKDFLLRPLTDNERSSNSTTTTTTATSSAAYRGSPSGGDNGKGGGSGRGSDSKYGVAAGVAGAAGAAALTSSTSFPSGPSDGDLDDDDDNVAGGFGNPLYGGGSRSTKDYRRAADEDDGDIVGGVELDEEEYVDATGDLGLPADDDDDYMYGDSAYLVPK